MRRLQLIEDSILLEPRDVDTLVLGVVEVRAPALTVLDGNLFVACDARITPVHSDWERTGGAMAADLPNPNSLLILRDSNVEVLRPGSVTPLAGYSDPSWVTDGERLVLFHARSADVGFFGSRPWQSDQDRNTLHIDIAISDDHGATWDIRTITGEVTAGFEGAFPASGHGLVVDDLWLQPAVVRDAAGATSHVTWRSADRGVTWSAGVPCGQDCDEATIEDFGGSLVMSARSTAAYKNGSLGRWWSRSCDAGAHWTAPVWEPYPPAAACNASLVTTPDGLMLVYAQAGRISGSVELRTAEGWLKLAELSSGTPFGYADAVWVDNELIVVYESAGLLRKARLGYV